MKTTRTKNSLNLTQATELLNTVEGVRIIAPTQLGAGCFVDCTGHALHLRMVDCKAVRGLHKRHALALVESNRFKHVYGRA